MRFQSELFQFQIRLGTEVVDHSRFTFLERVCSYNR